ncbi:MAG: DUF1566 domain-containing protein [Treponema sp.]|jgi:hypothetical protein|nr:DUF1566 domain-containing protein [Treponema sp.]
MKKLLGILCAGIALLMTACPPIDGSNLIGPAGGFVFYDKGSYSEGWRYMECAPENAGEGTWYRAKELCDEYSYGGYDDWFLPGIDELQNLLSDAFQNGFYWSSSQDQDSENYAWGIQHGNRDGFGNISHPPVAYSKSSKYKVRPVRTF